MALKPCKECGKVISDSAKVCPYCGIAYPGDYGPGKLVIRRRNTLAGYLVGMHISIDGIEVSILKVDGSLERQLESGIYSIRCWQSTWRKSEPFNVQVRGGFETKIEVYMDFWSTPKIEYT